MKQVKSALFQGPVTWNGGKYMISYQCYGEAPWDTSDSLIYRP